MQLSRQDKTKDIMKYYIYHICHEKDRGNFKEGYIGITNRPKRRWWEHRNKSTSCNNLLYGKITKHPDVIFYTISEGSKDEICRMENYFRPHKMGWNLTKGGGLPPNLKGHKWSEETRNKRTESIRKAIKDGRLGTMTDNKWKAAKKKRTRPFVLISPGGGIYEGDDLKELCDDLGLIYQSIHQVAKGRRKQNNQWKATYL